MALRYDSGTLTLDGWPATAVSSLFGKSMWVWDPRVEKWRTDAFRYAEVVRTLEICQIEVEDQIPKWNSVVWPSVQLPPMRAEQSRAIDAWCESRQGVVVMPTGTGKTEVALQLLSQVACSALIVAPVRDLMYQWHRRILRGLGYDAGILGDNQFNVRPITVTTYASACIHMPSLGDRFQFLIFDECHHLTGPLRSDAARQSIAPLRLGLTATLDPGDRGLDTIESLLGPVVHRLAIQEVRGATLADYDIVRIPVALSEPERLHYDRLAEQISAYVVQRRTLDPSFRWQDLSTESSVDGVASNMLRIFRQKQAIEERAEEKLRVLEDLFRLHHGSPMIVFTGSNAMAREVSLRFLIPCLLNHCGKRERLDYLEGLRDGVYPAIVANQVLDEGVDLPELKVAVILGGKASTRQAKQRLGRVLRRSGHSRAVLYEVVTADTNDALRSRKRRRSDAYTRARHRNT